MQFKHLCSVMEELRRSDPVLDEAEVKVNLGHSVVDLETVAFFLERGMFVLFPVSRPTGMQTPSREDWEKIRKKEAEGQ